MSRRKRHEAHANHERWLVSYADFITLLFAFFVVMFSASQVNKRKVGQIALAVQVAFQHLGIFDSSNSKIGLAHTEAMPFAQAQLVENVLRSENLGHLADHPRGLPQPSGSMTTTEISDKLQVALAGEIRQHAIKMHETREGLVISLEEIGFFESGQATLKPSSLDAVAKIAKLLLTVPNNIRIEGHTDNVPIHNLQFSSNWELSTARATELIAIFITQYKFSPYRLSAAGYAEFHPVASNDTPEGRAQNRRVDIVVLREQTLPDSPSIQSAETIQAAKPAS